MKRQARFTLSSNRYVSFPGRTFSSELSCLGVGEGNPQLRKEEAIVSHIFLFFVALGFEPQGLVLARQTVYHLSQAPSSFSLFFFF